MKKSKFVQVILTYEEWRLAKKYMEMAEEILEERITNRKILKMPYKQIQKEYNIVYHFNHVALSNIEDLIEKAEKERKRNVRKSKQIKN